MASRSWMMRSGMSCSPMILSSLRPSAGSFVQTGLMVPDQASVLHAWWGESPCTRRSLTQCARRLPAFLLLCVLRGFDLRYFLQPQRPGGLLAQHEFLHLAAGRQGIGLYELEVARNLLVTDLPFAEVA